MSEYVVELKNITKRFPGVVALKNMSIGIRPGEIHGLIGENGAGKSTTLNLIAGVFPVDAGTINLNGYNLTHLPEHKRAKHLGRVFQDPMMGTAATMGIEENLALAYRRGQKRGLHSGITSEERKLYREKLATLGLGLEDRMTSKVGLLSGGQRQALTLLMATLRKPDLLLLDEHTAALEQKVAVLQQELAQHAASADEENKDDVPWVTGGSINIELRVPEERASAIRTGIVERIEAEAERARNGLSCGIRMKCNSLVDEQIIDALYRASLAGVPVSVVVRGICALKAGVPGLSENIEVRSILGRFLEHSRVFHFVGIDERWIGSADMMHRNLDRRIEAQVRLTDPKLTEQLDETMDSALHPQTRCWVLNAKGDWEASPRSGEQVRDHQTEMLRRHGAKVS